MLSQRLGNKIKWTLRKNNNNVGFFVLAPYSFLVSEESSEEAHQSHDYKTRLYETWALRQAWDPGVLWLQPIHLGEFFYNYLNQVAFTAPYMARLCSCFTQHTHMHIRTHIFVFIQDNTFELHLLIIIIELI